MQIRNRCPLRQYDVLAAQLHPAGAAAHQDIGLGIVVVQVAVAHVRPVQQNRVVEQRSHGGHLWQNRYFACALGDNRIAQALAYVDNNPLRARLVESPADYPWSSAATHAGHPDTAALLDPDRWRFAGIGQDWCAYLGNAERDVDLEKCTYAGRRCGDRDFVAALGAQFGRHWTPGRPKKMAPPVTTVAQASLLLD